MVTHSKKTQTHAPEKMLFTQSQADAVLAAVAAYQTKKGLSDSAQHSADEAEQRAAATRSRWDLLVADDVDEPAKLVPALNELVEAAREANAKQAAAAAAASESSSASTALANAIYELINPPAA